MAEDPCKHLEGKEFDRCIEKENGQLVYRGTQRAGIGGVRKGQSYTPSKETAQIWSARPGDIWSRTREYRYPRFMETSTVHIAKLKKDAKVLDLCSDDSSCSFDTILDSVNYDRPDGMTDEEARRILNYMHNRLTGKARGGEFGYEALDENWEEIEEPFSLSYHSTPISEFRDDYFDYDPRGSAHRLKADTFIFADAPAFQAAAKRLGYGAMKYRDVFVGGDTAARNLLDKDIKGVEGVEMRYDPFDRENVPTHVTIRLLKPDAIEVLKSEPVKG